MTISAIIIVYNLENYVEAAILSVLNQTRLPDEIIVADDCSTDNSSAIIQKYLSSITHIRQGTNMGALKNTWSAVKVAKGDVIAFLDGDDVWMPDKIEAIDKLFLSDDAMCIASHGHLRVNENLELTGVNDETHGNIKRVTSNYQYEDWGNQFKQSILLRQGYWFGSAYCIRRQYLQMEVFEKITSQFAHLQWAYLDMALGPFMVASNMKQTVGFINRPLFSYRVHGSNSSAAAQNNTILLNSLNRNQYTNQLTCLLIKSYVNDPAIIKRYANLDDEHQLLRLQYEGKKVAAIKKFIAVCGFLQREKRLGKEFFRLMITTFFGVPALLKIKSKYGI